MKCKHRNCDHAKGVWLTTNLNRNAANGSEGRMRIHKYCEECGTVEGKAEERARGLGFFSNILGDMKHFLDRERVRFKEADIVIAKVHTRLIMKELAEIEDFEDCYWRSFSSQKEVFTGVVRKYLPRLSVSFINQFLEYMPEKKQSEEELLMQLYGLYEEEDAESKKDIYTDDELYPEG